MNSTQVRVPQQNVSRVRIAIILAAAAVLALFAIRAFAEAIKEPEVVDKLTIVNPTGFGVDVSVRGGDDDSWLTVGRALPQGETDRRLVLDQGDEWVIRFVRGDVVGGEVEVARSVLADAGWRIEVPADVATQLVEAGQKPNPTEGENGEATVESGS